MRTPLVCVLVLGAYVVPAHANYFHNPITNTNLNVGSAPNPTPNDLRAIGDSIYAFDARRRNDTTRQGLSAMQGKMVTGSNGETIGEVVAFDDLDKLVLIETSAGRPIVVSAQVLNDQGDKIVATTLTPARLAQLESSQGGRTAVYNEGGWSHSRAR